VPGNSAPTTSIDDDGDEREGCENDDNSGHGRCGDDGCCGDDEPDPDDNHGTSGPGGGDDDDGDDSGHGRDYD
jgi:hypothetical protein